MTPDRFSFALLVALVAGLGCLPGPTREFSDIGVGGNQNTGDASNGGTSGGGGGDGGMTNGGDNSQEFTQVATIITANCALGGCHGSPPAPNQVFNIPTGEDATASEVEAALSTTSPSGTGNLLVSPNAPEMSEIYVRITKQADDEQLMPPTGALAMEDIMTIESWISNGANY